MINQHTFESLILTNTIVVAFCIVLLVTFTVFIILFLVPSLRNRWLGKKGKDDKTLNDISSLSRQGSFHHLAWNSPRLNPLFEPPVGTTAAINTQFGTLFHPHATTATLLHPTIWTTANPSIAAPVTQSPPTQPPTSTPQKKP